MSSRTCPSSTVRRVRRKEGKGPGEASPFRSSVVCGFMSGMAWSLVFAVMACTSVMSSGDFPLFALMCKVHARAHGSGFLQVFPGFCQNRDDSVTGVMTHSERVELTKIAVETGSCRGQVAVLAWNLKHLAYNKQTGCPHESDHSPIGRQPGEPRSTATDAQGIAGYGDRYHSMFQRR